MTKLDWIISAVVFFVLIGDIIVGWVKDIIHEFRDGR